MTTRRKLLTSSLAIPALTIPMATSAQTSAVETTMDRISRTKVLRVGAVAGGSPFTYKKMGAGEWKGFCIDFAKDIADVFEAKLEIVETTWGNAVLDLESNKVDIFFGLSPTPKRALIVDYSDPLFMSAFAMIAKDGFTKSNWSDLNRPEVTISVDIGSSHEQIVTRICPNANVMRLKSVDEAVAAVQSGRADCQIVDVFLALTMIQKNPKLGRVSIPQPAYGASTSSGFRREERSTWRDFVNVWINYQKDVGGIRKIVLDNLADVGVSPEVIPEELRL